MEPQPPKGASPASVAPLATGISRLDARFGYLAYVPRDGSRPLQTLVVVHGSDFRHEEMCRYFARLADETACLVLAPLFAPPAGPNPDPNGYKFLRSHHAEYDRVLLDMVDAVAERFGCARERFSLFGFSGGAQFAHRFLYVHPARLHAASIAAPGMVTLIDPAHQAWVGTGGLGALCGNDFDLEQVRRVTVQLLVGSADAKPHVGEAGEEVYNHAGTNRVTRLRKLLGNYQANQIRVTHHEIPGATHEFEPLAAAAVPFLREHIPSR
ncbi:MAG: alpha/beta hydrolase [Gammaproteobacteria bacterium]|nr:alpha/beta hydrolase [Gammaproteobacteria bacterium]